MAGASQLEKQNPRARLRAKARMEEKALIGAAAAMVIMERVEAMVQA